MEELKKAPVTVLLILANILVFTAVEFTGGSEDTMHMLQCGAAYTPAIMQEVPSGWIHNIHQYRMQNTPLMIRFH